MLSPPDLSRASEDALYDLLEDLTNRLDDDLNMMIVVKTIDGLATSGLAV